MFFRNNNQPQPAMNDGDRAAQFTALVEVIRTEIRAGVDPLRGDISNLKLTVEEVRRAQQQMYTKEVVDLLFKDRDAQLKETRDDLLHTQASLDELRRVFGSLWQNTLVRVGAIVALGLSGLNLYEGLTRHWLF